MSIWSLLAWAIGLIVFLGVLWYTVLGYTGPDAERNFKRLTQGPFVPGESRPSENDAGATKRQS